MEMLHDPCVQSASRITKEDSERIRKSEDVDRGGEGRLKKKARFDSKSYLYRLDNKLKPQIFKVVFFTFYL